MDDTNNAVKMCELAERVGFFSIIYLWKSPLFLAYGSAGFIWGICFAL